MPVSPSTKKRRWYGGVIADDIARLVDVAPTEIVVLSEDTDWGLVGDDLREAIEVVRDEIAEQPDEERVAALVETS